jgi:hypothetical protein
MVLDTVKPLGSVLAESIKSIVWPTYCWHVVAPGREKSGS